MRREVLNRLGVAQSRVHGRSYHGAKFGLQRPRSTFLAAQRCEVRHLLWQSLSVCPSVRLSVTIMSDALTVQDIKICLASYDRGMFPVSYTHLTLPTIYSV